VRGGGDAKVLPQVEFQHEIIADSDINGPGYGSGGATPPSIASPTP
jgi:hypothetical protein